MNEQQAMNEQHAVQASLQWVPAEDEIQPEIRWRVTWQMFCANKGAVVGLILLSIIILMGLFGPVIYPGDPFKIVAQPFLKPGGIAALGTDFLGRDILTGIIYGARPTLAIAFSATLITAIVGLTVGALAGFFGGKVDSLLMGVTEFFQVLPSLIFAMVVVAVFTPTLLSVVVAIGVTSWTGIARLTRAEFLKLREREFVMGARAVGARDRTIIVRVILPNALPPLIIAMTLQIGICVLFEAALSFLGLSDPNIMTWGRMIGQSRDFFVQAWWTVSFPGLAILLTVLSIALIGDGLNDAYNPKLRGR
ncbi:MAG: ABC transporter permease [Candidimonas sp.]|nr:MAG: ABC transporter permease [Candidimonas sp.]TAM25743.1 MAG: ABC transporter permease [Candidimonas sp.]TAM74042.1 MAG: ABC transporter permease [Candidimonas sp.]